VKPGKIITRNTVPFIYKDYHIEAKNDKGEVVYSNVFTGLDLGNLKFKIVIPSASK
jgi:hypothetical protein